MSDPRMRRAAAALLLGLIVVLSLLPGEHVRALFELPGVTDTRVHFLGYLLLAWVLALGWPAVALWRIWAFATFCGLAIELIQIVVPGRGFEWSDLAVNAAGALGGIALAKAFRRRLERE